MMKSMIVKLFAGSILLCTLMPLSWAISPAETVIHDTIDQVLSNPSQLSNRNWVDQLVNNVFDFDRMSRYVLAQNWRVASEEERTAFVSAFRTLLVSTYATSLRKAIADGVKFDVTYLSSAGSAQYPKVRTLVKQTGKPPIAVDYDLFSNQGTWRVFNVTVEGVSLVTNYQNEFENQIKTQGMKGLIRYVQQQAGG